MIKPVITKVLLPDGSISEIDLNQYDMAIFNPVTDEVKAELEQNDEYKAIKEKANKTIQAGIEKAQEQPIDFESIDVDDETNKNSLNALSLQSKAILDSEKHIKKSKQISLNIIRKYQRKTRDKYKKNTAELARNIEAFIGVYCYYNIYKKCQILLNRLVSVDDEVGNSALAYLNTIAGIYFYNNFTLSKCKKDMMKDSSSSLYIYFDFLKKEAPEEHKRLTIILRETIKAAIDIPADKKKMVQEWGEVWQQLDKAARRQAEQAAEEQLEKYSAVTIDKRQDPNDKITKNMFTMTDKEWEVGGMNIIERKAGKGKEQITTPVTFRLDETNMTKTNSFDREVLFTCISARNVGNEVTSPNIIYRTMKGKTGSGEIRISKKMREEIIDSVRKMANIWVSIDASGVCREYKYTKDTDEKAMYEGPLLPVELWHDVLLNGEKTTAIKFLADSPVWKFAKLKNEQIVTYNTKLLDMPANTNSQMIVVPPYILRRMEEARLHPQLKKKMILDKILEDNGLMVSKNRNRYVEYITEYLDYLVKCKYLKAYKLQKEKAGRGWRIISYTYEFAKK